MVNQIPKIDTFVPTVEDRIGVKRRRRTFRQIMDGIPMHEPVVRKVKTYEKEPPKRIHGTGEKQKEVRDQDFRDKIDRNALRPTKETKWMQEFSGPAEDSVSYFGNSAI